MIDRRITWGGVSLIMRMSTERHEKLKQYYGKLLQGTKDLKSSACCSDNGLPPRVGMLFMRLDIWTTVEKEQRCNGLYCQ